MAEGKKHSNVAERFWGHSMALDKPARIMTLVAVLVAIASLSFTQLGFWSIGYIGESPVYLMLILGPLVLGAMLFGPYTGTLLGLYSGAVVFAHSTLIPLDYYEVYFMTPLNAFGVHVVIGAVGGLLLSAASKREMGTGARAVRIIGVCLVLSIAASVLAVLNIIVTYGSQFWYEELKALLLPSNASLVVQVVLDWLFMAVVCLIGDALLYAVEKQGNHRKLANVFRSWTLLVSATVFALASAVVFTVVTIQGESFAEDDLISEADYLAFHAGEHGDDYANLLRGYDVATDGYALITDENGTILASDYEEWLTTGKQLLDVLGMEEYESDIEESGRSLLSELAEAGSVYTLQVDMHGRAQNFDFMYIGIKRFDDGFAAVMRTSDMVFQSRFEVMLVTTLLAALLIMAIGVMATLLLRGLVVSNIGKINGSLDKITQGNLRETVRVRDTREFMSLSNGINATVAALRETIDEVSQKNAQELAAAKAIQESALPRAFPPFPDIDAFDIYASMKTAKEVGGDFYDFFLLGEDDDRLGFAIADVSGKGIPAALFMMSAKTQLRNYMEAGLPIDEAVDAANHQLCLSNDAGMFVTMFACELNYRTGELSYVNAGHNPPLLLRDGTWEWMRDVSGMPLGLFDGIPYERFSRQLEKDDVLYLYTDGVTEAMSAEGELFSEARLEQTLRIYEDMNPRSIGVGVRRAITDFTLDVNQSDDITMLVLKYGVPPEKKAVMVLPANVDQLVHVFNFIHEELHRRNAPKDVRNPLDIAAEELFVNVCHYAYPDATPENPGEVRIGFVYEANPPSLTVSISDDGIPYDPLAKPDAVTPDDIADVPIGGLGILMAKRSVDDMRYERVDGSNVVTFVKKW